MKKPVNYDFFFFFLNFGCVSKDLELSKDDNGGSSLKMCSCVYIHQREREMFYLTTHSTHFYLRLYDVRHMVKDHSDSEKGNPLPPHRLLLSINSKGSFICTIPQTG